MKRYASLDFLRGLAIFLMIFLHSIADILDIDGLLGKINDIPLMNVVALVVLPFLGGLAGMFLLVSAISNMVSMNKQLMKGMSVGLLGLRQFLGGFVLYLFAMLSEAVLNNYSALGEIFRNLDGVISWNWDTVFSRWGNFETIHTIAWCVMINGVIHALISIKGLWKKPRIQMLVYLILAIGVVITTKFVWVGVTQIVPGFPSGTSPSGYSLYMPHWFKSTPLEILQGIFFGALAAPMEPIFPYLAISFIGSIIGIAITQPKKALFKGFSSTVLITAFCMFLVGAIGVVMTIIGLINTEGFGYATHIYQLISWHRHWAPDIYPQLSWFAYLWQFLSVNGFSLMVVYMFIYIVDFRKKGQKFASGTKFIRRFGTIALTNYNFQNIYLFVNFMIPQIIFGLGPYGKTEWGGTFLQIGLTLFFYHLVMVLWEKVNYRGSLEWALGMIGYYLVPGRKSEKHKELKWYQKGDILVQENFYDAEWINVTEYSEEEYHRNGRDSRLVLILAICCLAFPIFIPVTCGLFFVIRKIMKKEGKNRQNKIALILCIIGIVITIIFFTIVNIFPLSWFGIYL